MTTFAVLIDGNYAGETVDLPNEFVMVGYVNLEKFPIPAGSKPTNFDYENCKWVVTPAPVNAPPIEPVVKDPAAPKTPDDLTKKTK
jgi:hypothetical protein